MTATPALTAARRLCTFAVLSHNLTLVGIAALGAGALLLPPGVARLAGELAGAALLIAMVVLNLFARRRAVSSRDELCDSVHQQRLEEGLLATSQEWLQLAQAAARMGTWAIDLTTGEALWSSELRELMGVDSSYRASYESFVALVHPDEQPGVERVVSAAIAEGGDFEMECRVCRPNGEDIWVLSRGRATHDEQGRPNRAVGVAIDISDRKTADAERAALEHQFRQAQKLEAVGRLAGGIAHDFNNLLLGMRGYGEIALQAMGRGEDATEEVEEMLTGADRAAALTRQLLAFGRRQILQPELVDLNEVVAEMDKLLGRLIGEDIDLRTVLGRDEVNVYGDRGQLEQVIANLAVNARDAMEEGRLTLEVTTVEFEEEHGLEVPPGRFALLAVSDTGSGMDAETAAQVFEPFFTTKAEGSGLGLATAHGIVQQSGGSIVLYSEPGEGTTVKVYLPLEECRRPRKPTLPWPRARPVDGGDETILLVEDDPKVRTVVRRMLEGRGYRVLPANGGEEALSLAGQSELRIDLLLTDVVMPGLKGRELAEAIRQLQRHVAVLYMSGYTDDAIVRKGALERGTAFIGKPFSSDQLAAHLRKLLDRRDGKRET